MKRFVSITVVTVLIIWLTGCAARKKRDFQDLQLSDFIHNELLEKTGIEVKKMPDRFYETDLVPFLTEFLADAKKRGVIIPEYTRDQIRVIKYVNKLSVGAGPGVVAACSRYYVKNNSLGGVKQNRWMIIEVLKKDSEDFTMGSRVRLRELIYHELFHCLLNKGHLPNGVTGIMSPVFNKGDERAYKDWDGLVNDMFSPEYLRLIDAEDAKQSVGAAVQ